MMEKCQLEMGVRIILKLLQLSFSVYADNKEIKLVTLEWEPYVGSN